MRQLSPSELRTALIAGGAVVALGSVLLVSNLYKRQKSVRLELQKLNQQLADSQSWLTHKDLWFQRKEWLDAHQPVWQESSSANLLEDVVAQAEALGLTIIRREIKDARPGPSYQEVSALLDVSGATRDVIEWLHALQRPDKFQQFVSLRLIGNKNDGTQVRANIVVARLCRLP